MQLSFLTTKLHAKQIQGGWSEGIQWPWASQENPVKYESVCNAASNMRLGFLGSASRLDLNKLIVRGPEK